VGGDDALLLLLQRLGDESGHRELKDAPLLFFGWSATASFGTTFAELHPDRTIGIIRYHSHRRGMTENLSVLKSIPTLIIAGGKDETAGVQDAEALWASGRAVRAPWTFAIEPNATHGDERVLFRTADNLLAPWITAVVGVDTEPVDVLVGQLADYLRGRLILPGRRASVADDDKPIAFGDPSAYKRFELFEERDIDTRLRDDEGPSKRNDDGRALHLRLKFLSSPFGPRIEIRLWSELGGRKPDLCSFFWGPLDCFCLSSLLLLF